ncbi:hypothetical protein HAX54_033262, partial [Datura stramonium]|nr:hypothetical protein [Datura stramonium]
PARRFRAKEVEPHGLTSFNTKKEANYEPENWKYEGRFALELLAIRNKIRQLGADYIFNEPERLNLTLAREFYANWDTSFGKSTK